MSNTIDTYAASMIDAQNRRFALAQQVGRLTGAIKLALSCLDNAEMTSPDARRLVTEARRVLRMALETEDGRT